MKYIILLLFLLCSCASKVPPTVYEVTITLREDRLCVLSKDMKYYLSMEAIYLYLDTCEGINEFGEVK